MQKDTYTIKSWTRPKETRANGHPRGYWATVLSAASLHDAAEHALPMIVTYDETHGLPHRRRLEVRKGWTDERATYNIKGGVLTEVAGRKHGRGRYSGGVEQ